MSIHQIFDDKPRIRRHKGREDHFRIEVVRASYYVGIEKAAETYGYSIPHIHKLRKIFADVVPPPKKGKKEIYEEAAAFTLGDPHAILAKPPAFPTPRTWTQRFMDWLKGA